MTAGDRRSSSKGTVGASIVLKSIVREPCYRSASPRGAAQNHFTGLRRRTGQLRPVSGAGGAGSSPAGALFCWDSPFVACAWCPVTSRSGGHLCVLDSLAIAALTQPIFIGGGA